MPYLKIFAILLTAVLLVIIGKYVEDASREQSADHDLSVAYFEPHAGGCAWYRRSLTAPMPVSAGSLANKSGASDELSIFPCDCNNVQWSWSPDGQSAVVWFDTETYGSHDEMLFEVDLTARKRHRLPVPEIGEGLLYVKMQDNSVLALTMTSDLEVDLNPEGKVRLLHEGHAYSPYASAEGNDVLVHALTFNQNTWRLLETKPSRCCSEGAPGIKVLDAYQEVFTNPQLSPLQSDNLLKPQGHYESVSNQQLQRQLTEQLPAELRAEPTHWLRLRQPNWAYTLVFRGLGDAYQYASGLAFLERAGNLTQLPAFPFAATDLLSLTVRTSTVLIAEAASGMRPHVYDLKAGALLWRAPLAHGGAFWPQTPPKGHPVSMQRSESDSP